MTAAEKILMKTLVGSSIDSRDWNGIQAGLRDRAFISSQVQSAKILYAARELSAKHAAGGADLSKIRMEMRKALADSGYKPDPEIAGTIKDLTSQARLDVIIKTNVAQARGYVQWLDANTPGGYAHAPAQELYRAQDRKQKRAWDKRWEAAGGKTYGGRMIALKDDPIWVKISRFGNPFPPFDWGSGMSVRNVSAREAIQLGLITKDDFKAKVLEKETVQKEGKRPCMNDNFFADVPFNGNTPEMQKLKDAFGDQITHEDGRIMWRGSIIRDKFNAHKDFELNLGKPTNDLIAKLPPGTERMLKSKTFKVHGSWFDKPNEEDGTSHRKHFGENETRKENIPLTDGDLDLFPTLWRHPDRVIMGGTGKTIKLELDTFDGGTLTTVINIARTPEIKTLYKKLAGVGLGAST